MPSSRSTSETLTRLGALAAGLLFISESDHDLTVVKLDEAGELDEGRLLELTGHPPESPVEAVTVAEFFYPAVQDRDFHSPEERANVRRYREIVTILERDLERSRVYRIGRIDIDVYAVGRAADGSWVGVATKVVET